MLMAALDMNGPCRELPAWLQKQPCSLYQEGAVLQSSCGLLSHAGSIQ
jgi:hypothetical protein